MTILEQLGKKCNDAICHDECPIYYFLDNGAGRDMVDDCMFSMRFQNVARNVELWLKGEPCSKEDLDRLEDEE